MPDVLNLESHALHPWGLSEMSFGHIGLGEETGLPFAKLHAKETIDFHRPKNALSKEKDHHGGEVTHYVRDYWLDDDGKLNYKTWIAIDNKALTHHRSGKLTRCI